MKTKSKIAIAVTASLAVGAMAFTLPSLAHESEGTDFTQTGIERGMHGDRPDAGKMSKEHNFVTLPASITGIPADVTGLREAAKGANYEIYRLASDATEAPATKPTTGGHLVGVHPVIDANGELVIPEITAGEVTGSLGFRATHAEGVLVFALYPSDDSSPVLVTVTTDSAGVATASATEAISLSYDADTAANFEPRGQKPGKRGHKGMRDHGSQHEDVAD